MLKQKIKNIHIVLTMSAVLLVSLVFMLNSSSNLKVSAAAPGCSSTRPTAIKGPVYAYLGSYHNWTVNVLVGIDLINSSGVKVKVDGTKAGAGYSYLDKLNPNLAPPGVSSGLERTFGASQADGNGVLCVASNVKTVWFELYPKNQSGATDKTYYGGANDQRMPVTVGGTNTYTLRLPTARSSGGNTGDINGFLKYNGKPISPSNLTIRVFASQPGTACGVQGFSAGPDSLYVNAPTSSTYYWVKNLAGGQCGQATQQYKLYVTCKNSACGSGSKQQMRYVNVANGSRPRVDINF